MAYFIFYKRDILFDTIVDAGVIRNPALDRFFLFRWPYYSKSYCLTSIILGRFYFLMEWCIERFLVKIISVAEIGVLKGFVKGNQSLLLCNHTLTHFLPNFTISPSYRSNADSIERGTGWGDFFLYDGKLYVG